MIQILLKILRYLPTPIRKRLFHVVSLSTRAMTLGVRVHAQRADGHVLLIKHTYLDGWHLPGGGVERGETVQMAAAKELLEETGYVPSSPFKLLQFYRNPSHSKYDHVALFTCEVEPSNTVFSANHEIAEIGFFAPDALPQDTTKATRARVLEVTSDQVESDIW